MRLVGGGVSSRASHVWFLLALLVPSALLASLQNDLTNHAWPANLILPGYATGEVSKDMLGTAPASIVQARCLVRGMLEVCLAVGGPHLEGYNLAIQFAAVWAALGFVYAAAGRVVPPFAAGGASLLAALFVPWGFLNVGYAASWPYDLPALAFAAAGTWAILARRFVPFMFILALGTLNKETVVFLLPAYLLAEWPRLPRRTWLAQASILTAVFALAYEIPRIVYTGSHLPTVTFSAYDTASPRWATSLGHLALRIQGLPLENIYWAFTLHIVPLFGWRMLPRSLKAIYACAPVLLVPVFFVGNLYELRLYNELIPLGAISTTLVLWRKLAVHTLPSGGPDFVG